MIFIVLVPLALALYLFFLFRRKLPTNDYKLHMVFGRKGAGKSTLLTRLAVSALADGQFVYSTLPIAGTHYFNGRDLGSFYIPENTLVLIDEIGMVFDPRNFKELKPYVRDLFKLQRHYKLTIYIFSQVFDDADKKLRDLTDSLWYTQRIGPVQILKHITKSIKFPPPESPHYGEIIEGYFLDSFIVPGSRALTYMPLYWKLFDSFICPVLPPAPEGKVQYLPPVPALGKKLYQKLSDPQPSGCDTSDFLDDDSIPPISLVNPSQPPASQNLHETFGNGSASNESHEVGRCDIKVS